MMNRNSGILLHITSLPSPYGVGNLGKAAFDFVDFLKKAGQSYWQILPICPPGYGDSPYQAFSTFAGNPYLIDPDQLVAAGWLTQEELDGQSRRLRRKSTARGSVENVLCAVSNLCGVDFSEYEVRFNIPGGYPADGPSAGVAMAVALYSALKNRPPLPLLAATGEVSIHGNVLPVGGVREKIEAAIEAGAERVLLPRENYDAEFAAFPC